MPLVNLNTDTMETLTGMRLPGESWDGAVRRWAGMPARVSLRTPAKPKPPKGKSGAPMGRWLYVRDGIRALGPGQQIVFPWLGFRDSSGAFPPQHSLMQAVNREIAKWQIECPEIGLSFIKHDCGRGYEISRRNPAAMPPMPKPWLPEKP
jgi:hypothetical protein